MEYTKKEILEMVDTLDIKALKKLKENPNFLDIINELRNELIFENKFGKETLNNLTILVNNDKVSIIEKFDVINNTLITASKFKSEQKHIDRLLKIKNIFIKNNSLSEEQLSILNLNIDILKSSNI